MAWSKIINQQRVKEYFKTVLQSGRLGHAYLFIGHCGYGTEAMAIELAKVLNCMNGKLEACDECDDCKKFRTLQHPNFSFICPLPLGKGEESGDDPITKLPPEVISSIQEQFCLKGHNPYYAVNIERSNVIKLNSIRELRRRSSISLFTKGKKVFLISNAELLNDESSNALLKSLEEPLEDTLIILTTAFPDSLRTTIRSRCQYIRFEPLSEEHIRQALIELESLSENEAAFIARLAEGNYQYALELISRKPLELRNRGVNFLRTSLYRPKAQLYREIEEIHNSLERSDIEQMLRLLIGWFRDTVTVKTGVGVVTNIDEIDTIRKFVDHHPMIDINKVLEILEHKISLLNKNVYIPLILINLSSDLQDAIFIKQTDNVITPL